jgi:carbamate kinase
MSNSSPVGKVAVVAVGGNSLIKDNSKKSLSDQYEAARESMVHVAGMIADSWNVVLTHGGGPQVGFILRRSELAAHELHTVSLDYVLADLQGAAGYMFQRALHNELRKRGIDRQVATVITQSLVDRNDPAFQNPSKPIGSFMDEATAIKHHIEDGWAVMEDAGRGWRRVTASPMPIRIIEAEAIKKFIDTGVIVICTGGGGIPVVEDDEGNLVGSEVVLDKDYGAMILATSIKADLFLISTAVEKVALNYNKPDQVWLDRMTLAQAKQYYDEGHFAKGSMAPKIWASIYFLEHGGKEALITSPENLERALRGETGTRIIP